MPRRGLRHGLVAAWLWVIAIPVFGAGILSINLCADVLLHELADPKQVHSLSYFARDPHYSPIHQELDGYALNSGGIEQIVAARPSLVLASQYSSAMTLDMLKRFGIEVYSVPSAQSISQLSEIMLELGRKIGQSNRAQSQTVALQRLLDEGAVLGESSKALRAIYLSPNGYSVGRGTLKHELISRAGYINLTADLGPWHRISIEQLIALRPDVIISAPQSRFFDRAHEWLAHPAIRSTPHRVTVPEAYWACPSNHLAAAFTALVEQKAAILRSLAISEG